MKNNLTYGGLLDIYINATEIGNKGTIWVNEKGIVVGSNRHFASQLGYAQAELTEKIIFEINPHLTMLSWRKLWQDMLQKKQPSIQTEHFNATNDLVPVSVRWEAVVVEKTTYACGVVEDLISSSRFEDLLDIASSTAKVATWEWDLTNQTFFFTKHFRQLLELADDFILQADNIDTFIRDRLSSRSYKELMTKAKEAIKTGSYIELELETSTDNSAIPPQINLAAQPLFLENRTVKVYGTIQDLSSISGRTDELYIMKFCMDYATECIIWVDEKGLITYANHAAALTYDFFTEDMKGQPIGRFVPHFKEQEYATYWQQLMESGMIEGEEKHLKSGGEFFIAWVSHNYISYQDRSFNCIFLKDLTDQKAKEESWKLSMTTIQQASDMVFWINMDGQIFYANKKATDSIGYSQDQLRKLKIFDISPSSEQENWTSHLAKIKTQKHTTYEGLMRRKNGKLFPVEITMSFILFEGNTIISAYITDITQKKAEALKLELAYEKIQQLKEEIEAENTILKEDIKLEYAFENIISKSEGYKSVLKKIEQVAATTTTVLILGETGTGKELLARAVHHLGDRTSKSMIKVNCGSLPANLIESELFGHEKGAFTGAIQTKKGRFELAHKGTIFLDEIGELPLDLQTQLLRVLQEGEFERVGGTKTIQVDVRVIAATNRNLEEKVQKGTFREDLFYRLNVFPIYNIPLRERKDDIVPLVRFFVDKYSKKMGRSIKEIPETALKKLQSYNFPGNVRELENIIERSIILSNSSRLVIDTELFRQETAIDEGFLSLDEVQKIHIIKALAKTKGRISGIAGAANLLEINPKTLISRMSKLGIEKHDYLTFNKKNS